MSIQNAKTTTAQVLNAARFTETKPQPFTDIVLHWLPPLAKMQGQARIVAVPGDWPTYNPDALAGCAEPVLRVNNKISIK